MHLSLESYRTAVLQSAGAVALTLMNFEHFILMYFWVAPHVLLVAVVLLMWHRRLHREFPIFFSYLVFEILQFCVLFTMYLLGAPAPIYVKADIAGRMGSIAFRFAILQELFEAPLANNVPLRRPMARALNAVAILLMVLSAVFIGSLYYSILNPRVFQAYVVIEALNTAQCGLLVLVFFWHGFLGLRMPPFVFGIALGMGAVVGFEPVRQALNDALGKQHSQTVNIVQMAIYHVAVVLWLYYAQVREKAALDPNIAEPRLMEEAAELRRITSL